jgi:hypothetical protein
VSTLPPALTRPANVFRLCLHPEGLARSTLNFPEWAAYLLGQLSRLRMLTADPAVAALAEEVGNYPNVSALQPREQNHWPPEEPELLVPWTLSLDGAEVSFFKTLTSFGTARDITLAELAIALFYPADEATATALRRHTLGGHDAAPGDRLRLAHLPEKAVLARAVGLAQRSVGGTRRPPDRVEDRYRVKVVAPSGDLAVDDREHRDVPVCVGSPGGDDTTIGGVLKNDHAGCSVVMDGQVKAPLEHEGAAVGPVQLRHR